MLDLTEKVKPFGAWKRFDRKIRTRWAWGIAGFVAYKGEIPPTLTLKFNPKWDKYLAKKVTGQYRLNGRVVAEDREHTLGLPYPDHSFWLCQSALREPGQGQVVLIEISHNDYRIVKVVPAIPKVSLYRTHKVHELARRIRLPEMESFTSLKAPRIMPTEPPVDKWFVIVCQLTKYGNPKSVVLKAKSRSDAERIFYQKYDIYRDYQITRMVRADSYCQIKKIRRQAMRVVLGKLRYHIAQKNRRWRVLKRRWKGLMGRVTGKRQYMLKYKNCYVSAYAPRLTRVRKNACVFTSTKMLPEVSEFFPGIKLRKVMA